MMVLGVVPIVRIAAPLARRWPALSPMVWSAGAMGRTATQVADTFLTLARRTLTTVRRLLGVDGVSCWLLRPAGQPRHLCAVGGGNRPTRAERC